MWRGGEVVKDSYLIIQTNAFFNRKGRKGNAMVAKNNSPKPTPTHPASSIEIIHYQLSIFCTTFAAQSKFIHKMDDGPANRRSIYNLLSAGMSSLS
jgi:hypothetical protein